jgi:hypothetical protein
VISAKRLSDLVSPARSKATACSDDALVGRPRNVLPYRTITMNISNGTKQAQRVQLRSRVNVSRQIEGDVL